MADGTMPPHPIPDAALAHHIAILAKTGAGKTVLAKGLAERILARDERFCAIDPTGAWWGLRLMRDGVTPSPFKVVIFGGRYADAPIGAKSGPALARIIGQGNVPAVIDTSLMTVGERTAFFTDFAEAVFRENDAALHLFIDEAHLFAPQGRVADPQSGRMVHAANNLVSGGRSRGFRITMISQRAAKLHKDSLTQVETLVAMRLIAPQDRAAVEDWIGEWGDAKKGREIIASLPSLSVGEGWVWSPEIELLARAKFPMIRTFDSSKAPEHGETRRAPRALDADEISELTALLEAEAPARRGKPVAEPDAEALQREFERGRAQGDAEGYARGRAEGHRAGQGNAFARVMTSLRALTIKEENDDAGPSPSPAAKTPPPPPPPRSMTDVVHRTEARIVAGHNAAGTKLLAALASYPGRPVSWADLCVAAGMMHANGYFYGGRKHLAEHDLVEDREGAALITSKGLAAVGGAKPALTRAEILSRWSDRKSPAPLMLSIIAAKQPSWVSVDELAQATGNKPGNGYWYGGIKALRSANLIEEDRARGFRLSSFIADHAQ